MDATEQCRMKHDADMPVDATVYVCPMHPDEISDKPGKCPKCDMALVETTKVKHGQLAEENWRKTHPAATHEGHQH